MGGTKGLLTSGVRRLTEGLTDGYYWGVRLYNPPLIQCIVH